jgi:hypothetical protein
MNGQAESGGINFADYVIRDTWRRLPPRRGIEFRGGSEQQNARQLTASFVPVNVAVPEKVTFPVTSRTWNVLVPVAWSPVEFTVILPRIT